MKDPKALSQMEDVQNLRGTSAISSHFILANQLTVALIVSAISVFILYLRLPGLFSNPQFWAEDGTIFFEQQMNIGHSAIFIPYAGYLHLVPRCVSALASLFSAAIAPTLYLAAAMLMAAWAALTLSLTRASLAPVFALTLFVAPHSGEVFGTITNVQWILSTVIPVIVLTESPKGYLSQLNQRAYILFSGLSGPFSALACPLFLYRLFWRRDRHGLWVSLLGMSAGAVQLYMILKDHASSSETRAPLYVAIALLDRWFGMLAHGWRSDSHITIALTVAFGALVAVAALEGRDRRLAIGMLLFCGAIMGATWVKYMPGSMANHFDLPVHGDRYLFAAKTYAIWILILGVTSLRPSMKVLSAAALVVIPFNYSSHGHDWWRRPPLEDKNWKEHARLVDEGIPTLIPINPAPWNVAIPGSMRQQ
ncbi:hypothetical protein [Cystobacter fuscus]|uniref:hypothetical protein n=1 Tax=Cystobacter fuscus TaxID=43 RepID=UPI002B29A253|nr:hypothetical protein F0U63_18960 [Cystobacter fuscus]